jgi:fructosamine-3-kinase
MGGDTNETWFAETARNKWFVKTIGDSRFPGKFQPEKEGLDALANAFNGVVPHPLAKGEIAVQQYLIIL